jgi:glycosyltransferase involved in cell wall biosynthesis
MKQNEKHLSIGIPAFNEEGRIQSTLLAVYKIAQETLDRFEILVVDDGSTDKTYELAQEAACQLGVEVQVIRRKNNQGVGSAFRLFLETAKFPYICLIPGDNAYTRDGIKRLFSSVGEARLVISFRGEMKQRRTKLRFILSKIATAYLSILVGKKVRDAHSLFVFPVEETRRLNVSNTSYGYHMETLSRLLRRLDHFHEVSVELTPAPDASSGVMRPRVLWGLGVTMLKLIGLRLINKL